MALRDDLRDASEHTKVKSVEAYSDERMLLSDRSTLIVLTPEAISVEKPFYLDKPQKVLIQENIEVDGDADEATRRSTISTFSRESQTRFIKLCSAWKPESRVMFATLTYPKHFPDTKTAKVHFDRFLKRLYRKFPDTVSYTHLTLPTKA